MYYTILTLGASDMSKYTTLRARVYRENYLDGSAPYLWPVGTHWAIDPFADYTQTDLTNGTQTTREWWAVSHGPLRCVSGDPIVARVYYDTAANVTLNNVGAYWLVYRMGDISS
jgi:hypothetical protein